MNSKKLSQRLRLCADFVTEGCRVADIGTDHAALPVFLVQSGRCGGAVASDLRKGPLSSAGKNIEAAGLSEKISTRLSNGFDKIAEEEFDEAVIAGMGGLLICDILRRTPYRNSKSFILQPMSDPEEVRRWLYLHGFEITREKAACEGKRVYVVMRADYTGQTRVLSDFEALAGTLSANPGKEEKEYFKKLSRTLDKQIEGKGHTDADISPLKALKSQIDILLR